MLVIGSGGWWWCVIPCAVELWRGLMLQSMVTVLCTRP